MTAGNVVDFPQRKRPHNVELEQALLGAILLNNEALGGFGHWLEPEDFYEPLHQDIYEVCRATTRKGLRADAITLKSHFEGYEDISDVTVPQYLGRLAAGATSVMAATSYARNIKELARLRALVRMSEWLGDQVDQMGVEANAIGAQLLGDLDQWMEEGQHGRVTRHTGEEAALAGLEDTEAAEAITTSLIDLDKKLGGFHRGELTIVGARPSMGKSMFASSALLRTAMAGEGVAFFSLEMTAKALGRRMASDLAWNRSQPIPYFNIGRDLIEYERTRLLDAAKKLHGIPLMIDDKAGVTVPEIASRSRGYAKRLENDGHRLGVVVVDHLGKVKPSKRRDGNKVAETGDIVGALAALAKDLDVAVVALQQINRQTEGREDKRPTLADLRWSGASEEDADTVLFLYRPAYYLERQTFKTIEEQQERDEILEGCKNSLEIIVAKQRNGPLGTVKAFCDVSCNVVRDASTGR